MTDEERQTTAERVAVILAIGIASALNFVTLALVWAAFNRLGTTGQGLSENGTQLLTGWGGGIIGVLGAYVGYSFGRKRRHSDDDECL